MEKVLIVGAGGFGRSVCDALMSSCGYVVVGFVDDRGREIGAVLGHAVLGRIAELGSLREHATWLVVAIGDNARRREVYMTARSFGFELATVVHPRALVSSYSKIGAGAMVMAGALIGPEASVGEGAIVNSAAVVDHHAIVGEFAHLGVGACMGGGSVLAAGAWMQEGVVLRAGQVFGLGKL